MRSLIRQAIVNDATLIGLGVAPAGVFMGDADTPQERPFIQLRWEEVNPGVSTVNVRRLVAWVHDVPGDYTRIDNILKRLRDLFAELEAEPHETGWLVQTEWITDSSDLADDGHGTITRTTTHNLIGSGL